MAITRCPYCHSLVDETSKYCQNCGTQLLFPEDEGVEEEIPGEKIIEIEEEEPDTVEPGELEIGRAAEEESEEKEEKTTEPVPVYELEETEDDSKEEGTEEAEEVTLIEEIERLESGSGAEAAGEPESAETTQVLEPGPTAVQEEASAAEVEAEPATERVETGEAAFEAAQPAETEEAEEARGETEEKEETRVTAEPELGSEARPGRRTPAAEARGEIPAEEPAAAETVAGGAETGVELGTFDTRELGDIGKTTDLGRMRLDRLFDEIMEDREERGKAEKVPEEEPKKSSGTLPPWADAMIRGGETPAAGDIAGERPSLDTDERFMPSALAEEAERELEDRSSPLGAGRGDETGSRRRSDSTIGLPEKITPLSIPFETEEGEEEEVEEEGFLPAEEAEEDKGFEKEREVAAPCETAAAPTAELAGAQRRDITGKPIAVEEEERRPFSFSVFFKSRLFDVLFVGVFWLVALWLAAHSMGATIFDLLAVTARPLLAFLAVLVAVYIFLFKFFLGETLGDRLFRERE